MITRLHEQPPASIASRWICICAGVAFLGACVEAGEKIPLPETMIVGSAESPDPVLERVMDLEREGIVKDVVVMESFPVQIHLRAPAEVIEELNRIPRVKGDLH